MHPEIKRKNKGKCPKCGMDLVPEGSKNETRESTNYFPLIIIIGLILLVAATLTFKDINNDNFLLKKSVSYFMAGFFIVFGGFKLLDLKGFAHGYATYDLLAQKVPIYGYLYPFIELFFGLAMIMYFDSLGLLLAEIIVMSFSGLGVVISLMRKQKIKCLCLGTLISNIPLTKVTLIEDFGMAALALVMLFL